MNRALLCLWNWNVGVPRACGDEPSAIVMIMQRIHAFPAHAGMNRLPASSTETRASVPRACGDEPPETAVYMRRELRSPRMRG